MYKLEGGYAKNAPSEALEALKWFFCVICEIYQTSQHLLLGSYKMDKVHRMHHLKYWTSTFQQKRKADKSHCVNWYLTMSSLFKQQHFYRNIQQNTLYINDEQVKNE